MNIQAQTMTKKEIKLYYPYRDHKLASNIIKILASNPKVSNKSILLRLSDTENGATPPSIKIALTRLKDTGYAIQESVIHKSQTHNIWELSCLGNLVALTILKDDELYSFINDHKEEKFYKMIDVLTKSSKKDLLDLLISRIYENDHLKIEVTALEWYNDMRRIISNIDTSRHPELESLQEKINRDGFDPVMLSKKGFIIDPELTHTQLDRIC